MKKCFYLITMAALSASLVFTGCGRRAVDRNPNTEYQLVLLHTNDSHGSVEAKDGKGGLAERATYIKKVRSEEKNVLLIDAGDISTGSAVSNLFHAAPDAKAYNLMQYDAVALGNHEFDTNLAVLNDLFSISEFSWICANIKKGDEYLVKPYITKDFEGFRVGVFGLTTTRTLDISKPNKELFFYDEIKTAREMVEVLRNKEKCDIVILLSHLGNVYETSSQNISPVIAEQVEGIDIIVDGHSHTFLEEPIVINDTRIITAGEKGQLVGNAKIGVKDGKIVRFEWKCEEITSSMYVADAEVQAMLKPYITEANATLKNVVLHTERELEFGKRLTRYQEMPLGDFVADSIVNYLKMVGIEVDGAIENGGGIRAALPAGDVTKEQIVTVLPFDNTVYVVTLTGEDTIKLFEYIGSIKQGAGGFAQVSKNIRYTITYNEAGEGKISDLTIGGSPVDPSRKYSFATNDYMANGGDGYIPFVSAVDKFNTSMLLSDAVIAYAQTLSNAVDPQCDGRITVIGGKLPE